MPVLCAASESASPYKSVYHIIPRFGVGSSSCAGRENRTAARSATPINLQSSAFRVAPDHIHFLYPYLLRTPKKVLSFEPSSGGFSTGAVDAVSAGFAEASAMARSKANVQEAGGKNGRVVRIPQGEVLCNFLRLSVRVCRDSW